SLLSRSSFGRFLAFHDVGKGECIASSGTRANIHILTSVETTSRRPRLHDWTSFAATLAVLAATGALVTGRFAAAAACLLAAVAAGAMARSSSQQDPGPMPYALRWVLYLPRWPTTVSRLRAMLEPRRGERLLEVGPGVGVYALPIASALAPDGTLDALDVQREMLDDLAR